MIKRKEHLKQWRIYYFNREAVTEYNFDDDKGEWRPYIVVYINKSELIIVPLSSSKSINKWTVEYLNSPTRKLPSYVLVNFFKAIDPRIIEKKDVCKEIFNKEHNDIQAIVKSKRVKKN